jgi:hypothetical protein
MLKALCEKQIANGNGNRMIVISDDNEGNGFHGLFYGFTPLEEKDKDIYADYIYDSVSNDMNEIIILG